jgi:hypothetical protein
MSSLDQKERREPLKEAAASSNFLSVVAAKTGELSSTEFETLCQEILQNKEPLAPPAYTAYWEHLKNYCIAQGILTPDRHAESLTWEEIQKSKNPDYIISSVRKVIELNSSIKDTLLISQPLPILIEIFHQKLLTDKNPIAENYKEIFMVLNKLTKVTAFHDFNKAAVKWDELTEILSRFCQPEQNYTIEQESLIIKPMIDLLPMNCYFVPHQFVQSCAKLLNGILIGSQSEELKTKLARSIAADLPSLMLSYPVQNKHTHLGRDLFIYPYNCEEPSVNKTQDNFPEKFKYIRELLAPYCQSHLEEISNVYSKRVLEGAEYGFYRIQWQCAAYIISRMSPQDETKSQELIIRNLVKAAAEAPNIDDRTLAKYYLYKLYDGNRGDNNLVKAFSEVFTPYSAGVDEKSAVSFFKAAKQILSENIDYGIIGVLSEIARNSKIDVVKKEAAAIIYAFSSREGNDALRALFYNLDPSYVSTIPLKKELLEDIKAFEIEVLEPFAASLQNADRNVAVYSTTLKAKEETANDQTHNYSLYKFPYDLRVSVHLDHVENVNEFSKAFVELKEKKEKFNKDHKLQINFDFEVSPEEKTEVDLFKRLKSCDAKLGITHSLSKEVMLVDGQRLRKVKLPSEEFRDLDSTRVILEPKAKGLPVLNSIKNGLEEVLYNCPRFISLEVQVQKEPGSVELVGEKLEMAYKNAASIFQKSEDVSISLCQFKVISVLDSPIREEFIKIISIYSGENAIERNKETVSAAIDIMLVSLFQNSDKIVKFLNELEPHEAVYAEIKRTIEILVATRNSGKNPDVFLQGDYHEKPFRGLATYFPRNEPLFSLVERAFLPSLIHERVYARLPECFETEDRIRKLAKYLGWGDRPDRICANVDFVRRKDQNEESFVPKVKEEIDTLLYSGSRAEAEKKRMAYLDREPNDGGAIRDILLLGSGEGHNPLVICKNAKINQKLIDEVIKATVYNSGQNCTRPCSILVEGDFLREEEFLKLLHKQMRQIPVGIYNENFPEPVRIGPLVSAKEEDWEGIIKFRRDNSDFIYWGQSGPEEIIVRDKEIVLPTIFRIPLVNENGSYQPKYGKQYAPFFIVQRYTDLDQLMEGFFSTKTYTKNAMYISLFSESHDERNEYYKKLAKLDDGNGTYLHKDQHTILQNRTLNSPGVDLGYDPFGGYGPNAKYMIDSLGSEAGPRHVLNDIRFGIERNSEQQAP